MPELQVRAAQVDACRNSLRGFALGKDESLERAFGFGGLVLSQIGASEDPVSLDVSRISRVARNEPLKSWYRFFIQPSVEVCFTVFP